MRTIDFYIDQARKNSGIQSDAKLGKSIGLSRGAITQFRTKRSWPSEETLTSLAELAGIDPADAVLELGMWKTTGKAHQVYKSIYSRLHGVLTVMIIVFMSLTTLVNTSFASQVNNTPQPIQKYTLSRN